MSSHTDRDASEAQFGKMRGSLEQMLGLLKKAEKKIQNGVWKVLWIFSGEREVRRAKERHLLWWIWTAMARAERISHRDHARFQKQPKTSDVREGEILLGRESMLADIHPEWTRRACAP